MSSNTTSHDPVHSPAHYTVYPVQPIEITRHMDFCLGNAVKYALRAPFKGGVEDIQKARQYLVWAEEDRRKPFYNDFKKADDKVDELVQFLVMQEDSISAMQGNFLYYCMVLFRSAFRKDSDSICRVREALKNMRIQLDELQSLLEARP